PDGYILTVSSLLLDTQDLRVHLPDGRRFKGYVVATEPQLDVALVKVDKVDNLPYFDISKAAAQPLAGVGTGVVAFSNLFEIATRDEPVSIQQGVISAYSKLHGRRGIYDAAFTGDVYVVDAITNNPGAAGGALTNRKGELLGIIGKELINSLSDTWINYAVPLQAKVEVQTSEGKKETVALVDFVEKVVRDGKWKQLLPVIVKSGQKAYHGIVLVPDVVERTPPYVDGVVKDSPAFRAGLKPDDQVVRINGEPVSHIKVFNDIMSKIGPGSKITV